MDSLASDAGRLEVLRAEHCRQSMAHSPLLSPAELSDYAKKLDFGWFGEQAIVGLWQIGLLRADQVLAERQLTIPGLQLVRSDYALNEWLYSDFRRMAHRPVGYGNAIKPQDLDDVPLLSFHPYRIYVLRHLVRTIHFGMNGGQFLLWEQGVSQIIERQLEDALHWTSSESFSDRFDYWNRIAEIAILCEPVMRDSNGVFGKDAVRILETYSEEMIAYVKTVPLNVINEQRRELALEADELDGNRRIHTLLRLMSRQHRDQLEGKIGAAMVILEMAEAIRRVAERALSVQLEEEDEIGPFTWIKGARKRLYGTERVFDAPRSQLRDFTGILGLDYGTKVRCYVEGDTEAGALRQVVGAVGRCVIVNLRGQVAERRGRGVTFKESLAADLAAGVFSVIIIDADRNDYVRVVQDAARKREFFGRFFLFGPDVEYGNFSFDELVDIASTFIPRCADGSVNVTMREKLRVATADARNGDQFCSAAKRLGITEIGKGDRWGEALMAYASEHRHFPQGHSRAGALRPLVEAAALVVRAQGVTFGPSRDRYDVNPEDGTLVAKQAMG